MPKYTFICEKCKNTKACFVKIGVKKIDCDMCDGFLLRQMPKLSGPSQVNEVIDHYTGVSWVDDQEAKIKQRKDKYYWEIEVPRMVNSGTYSIETMLEMGWVYLNEKEEVCINNKPPSER